MRTIMVAFFAMFLMTGCSWEELSLSQSFRPHHSQDHKAKPKSEVRTSSAKKKTTLARSNRVHRNKAKHHYAIAARKLPKTYLYYLHSATLPELRHYLDSGRAAEDLPLSKYTLLRERRKGMEEDALIRYGTLKELVSAYNRSKSPRLKRRILELMKEKEKTDGQS